jgi:hypothetical protein
LPHRFVIASHSSTAFFRAIIFGAGGLFTTMPPELEALVQSWNLPRGATARVHAGFLELEYHDEAHARRLTLDFPLERLTNGEIAPDLLLHLEKFRNGAAAKGE